MKIVKIEKRKKTWSFKDHENKPFLAQKHALRRQKLSGKKFCQSPVSHSRHDPDECNRATPESAPVNQSINLWNHRFIQSSFKFCNLKLHGLSPSSHQPIEIKLYAISTRFATTSNLITPWMPKLKTCSFCNAGQPPHSSTGFFLTCSEDSENNIENTFVFGILWIHHIGHDCYIHSLKIATLGNAT